MRSDPLLLAQIAEGNVTSNFDVHDRVERRAFPNDRCVPELEKAATHVGIDFIASWSVHMGVCPFSLPSLPISSRSPVHGR